MSGWIKERLLSAFPRGTFAYVEVLEYGDDPAVQPGDAVQPGIPQSGPSSTGAGRPAETWDSREAVDDFVTANSEGIGMLHDGLLPSIAWVDFVLDTPRGSRDRELMARPPATGSNRTKAQRSESASGLGLHHESG